MFGTVKNSNNITQDRYDRVLFDELKEASGELSSLVASKGGLFGDLLQDIWATYYKADPKMTDKVDLPYQANRPFVERVLEDPQTQILRTTTMLDELSAGLAALAAGQTLAQEIKDRPELERAMEKAQAAQRAANKGDHAQAEQLIAEAEQTLQQNARDLRRAIRVALEKGQEKADEIQTTLGAWGLGTEDIKRIPLEDRLNMMQRMSQSRLKKIAELVGRFRNLARARQKQKLAKQRDEIHSITIGADLGRVLPTELSALTHPLRKADFYRKYNEKALLQYKLRTNEPQGRGPMIVLVDRSGSMGGQPMEWAVATAMGLVDTASRQKRQAAVIYFDDRVVQETHFKPGEKNPTKLVEVATMNAGGGTEYVPALDRARQLVTEQAYKNADIVMVTDGVCRTPDTWREQFLADKQRLGFKTYTVLIGNDTGGELKKWSDKLWAVKALDEEVAGELFEEVY